MSEESKSDYVNMGDGAGGRPGAAAGASASAGAVKLPEGLDDPSLSQEDRDLRLAIALQQQENAAAYDAHKKKHDAAVKADALRTTRSNTHSRLARVRDKDHGMLSVPKEYTSDNAYVADESEYASPGADMDTAGMSPQEIADRKLAAGMQKVENSSAGTAAAVSKIVKEEKEIAEAQAHRTQREGFGRGFA